MISSHQSSLFKIFFFLAFTTVLISSELHSQSKFYLSAFLETQSSSDQAYYDGSKFLNGFGLGYNFDKHIDAHMSFSYSTDLGHADAGAASYEYVYDSYSFLLGFNIKPWGTIIKNPNVDFGRFTPYLGFELKKRTLYDYFPFGPTKISEWILIANMGTEFSMTRFFSVFSHLSWKVPGSSSYTNYKFVLSSVRAKGDYSWGVGVKFNMM